jgi:hypothetical protein
MSQRASVYGVTLMGLVLERSFWQAGSFCAAAVRSFPLLRLLADAATFSILFDVKNILFRRGIPL